MASLSPSSSSTTSTNSDADISPPTTPRTRIAFPSLAFSRPRGGSTSTTISLKSPPSPPTITSSSSFPTTETTTLPTRPSPPLSSLTPTSSPFSGSSALFSTTSPYAHCAYPSWPRSDSLCSSSTISSQSASASSSAILPADSYNFPTPAAPTSYITDDDLLDLESLPLYNNIRIAPEFLVAKTPVGAADMGMGMEKERRRSRSKRAVVLPQDVENASVPAVSMAKVEGDVARMRIGNGGRRRSSPLKRRRLVLGLSPVVEMVE